METTQTLTEAYLLALEATEDKQIEVVAGQLVAVEVTGEEHGWIEMKLSLALGNYVVQHKLGRLYPGDTSFVLDGDESEIRLLRKPDLGFVPTDKVNPTKGYIFTAPDLAVEIVPPSQSHAEMVLKADEYLAHGTQEVWLVVPEAKSVQVIAPDGTTVFYKGDDEIRSAVLAGFTLRVSEIF